MTILAPPPVFWLRSQICVIYVPEDSRLYYSFFRPELASRDCNLKTAGRITVAVSPRAKGKAGPVERMLREAGFVKRTEQDSCRPHHPALRTIAALTAVPPPATAVESATEG